MIFSLYVYWWLLYEWYWSNLSIKQWIQLIKKREREKMCILIIIMVKVIEWIVIKVMKDIVSNNKGHGDPAKHNKNPAYKPSL